MADYLGQSASRANQMSAAALPYIEQGADFGTPLVRGVQSGMQMAGMAQDMALRQAEEERQQQSYAQRTMMFAAELDLRQRQATTQAIESQTALQRAQNEAALFGLKQQSMEFETDASSAEFMENILGSTARKRGDGKYDVWSVNGSGQPVFKTGVEETDPDVVSALERRDMGIAERQARTDRLRSQSDYDARRGSGSSNGSVKYEPTYGNLIDREKALSESLRYAKGRSEDSSDYMSPEETAAKTEELRNVQARLRRMAQSPEDREPEPSSNGSTPSSGSAASALPMPPEKDDVVQWTLVGLRRQTAAKFKIDDGQMDKALLRIMELARGSGQDVDPIRGGRISDETLLVNILRQIQTDDEQGRALAEMFRKVATR